MQRMPHVVLLRAQSLQTSCSVVEGPGAKASPSCRRREYQEVAPDRYEKKNRVGPLPMRVVRTIMSPRLLASEGVSTRCVLGRVGMMRFRSVVLRRVQHVAKRVGLRWLPHRQLRRHEAY